MALLLLPLLSLFAACGDDEPKEAGFAVVFDAPSASDTLYTNTEVAFAVSVTPLGDQDLSEATFEYDWSFGDGATGSGLGPNVTHSYTQQGPREVEVTARRTDASGETTATLAIMVNAAADLTIDQANLTLTTAVVRSDDTFRLSGNLLNQAAAVPGAFDVGYYAAQPSVLENDTLDASRLNDLIDAGSVYELDRSSFDDFGGQPAQAIVDNEALTGPVDMPSGEYAVFLFADPDDVVGENDETNNYAVATRLLPFQNATGDGAELVASAVSVRPALANVLSSITLNAEIRNDGTAFAEPFEYTVYLSADNSTLQEDDRPLLTGNVDNIPAGDRFLLTEVAITLDPPVTELGDYFILVEADSGNAVAEPNETNNVSASARITVTDIEIPGADILPVSFAVAPDTTFIGGSVQIDLAVSNVGDDPVDRQFNCRFYLSEDSTFDASTDTLLQSLLVPPLAPGEDYESTLDAFVPPIAPGEYTPIVACDPTLLIAESDDANNVLAAESTIAVATEAAIDLRPQDLSVDPLVVANDDPTTVSVDVCNDGSNGSTPSIVRVFISQDDALDLSDFILLESRVPPINAGECITILAEVAAQCDTFVSEYTVFAVVDSSQLVAEVDENNNTVELDEPLEITGLICSCEDDRFEQNNTPASAAFLNPTARRFENLSMCSSNVDYYLIPMLADETVRVSIDFDHDRGDLDMELFALDRSTLLDSSATLGDREEVSYLRMPTRGNYLLRVQGKTPQDRNVYDLDIEVTSPQEGTDLIVLDVTTDEERPVLGADVEVCFDIINLGDTPAGASLARVYLTEDTTLDPIEDTLIGSLEVEAFDSRIYRCVSVSIPEATGGGPRYIAVLADARDDVSGELSETNNVGLSPLLQVDSSCFDVLEPNNSAEGARTLELFTDPPVSFTELLACSDNRDFYELCLSDGDYLTVSAAFDPIAGDIDMKLYEDGVEVDRSEGVGDNETVGVDFVAGDRCYTVEVYVAGLNREVPYTLTVDSGRAPDSLACSRIEEPSDTFGAARPLRDFLDDCMAVCPTSDEDYFYVQLSPGSNVEFALQGLDGSDPEEDLRLTLWGPARNFLRNTISATEVLSYSVALSGRHYLRVRSNGDGPRNQPYCLTVEGVSGIDLVPTDLTLEVGAAAPGETVRFTYTLANARDTASLAGTYAIYLSTDPVLSPDDTLLREVELAPLVGLGERTEGRRFDVPAELVAGGEYYVILRVDDGEDNAEFNEANNVLVTPFTVTPRCLPDVGEPNNFPIDATAIEDVDGEDLSSCGSVDVDWFVFTATVPITVFSIDFLDAEGDLNLYVYEEDGPTMTQVAFSDGIGDGESVEVFTDAGTRYFVEVRQHTDQTPAYTLTVE